MKASKYELTILVPVYNEERTLQAILERVTSLPIKKYEVIIVNDASKDSSPKIIRRFLKKFKSPNVNLLEFSHETNQGKGAAIQTGIKAASGEYFVIQDADLEYSPEELPGLLSTAKIGGYRAIYGSRFMGNISNMAPANYVANRFYNILLKLLYRVSITDMHTCYKMVKTDLLRDLHITANGFDYATELVSKLLKRDVVIHEMPISFSGRSKKDGKKIDLMDGIECLYKLLRYKYFDNDILFREKSTTFGRFMLVGVVGFLVNYTILASITELKLLDYLSAEILAALVALHVTFALHDRWTYRLHTPVGTAKLSLKARYAAYLASNGFGAFMTVVFFGFLFMYINRLPALLIAAVAGIVWNYLMNTYVIWRPKKRSS